MTPRIRSLMAALVLAMVVPPLSAAAQWHPRSKPSVRIPAGTYLDIRLAETLHVNVTRPAATYRAVLHRPVTRRRAILIPGGARVTLRAVNVRQTGRSARLLLTANDISFGGRTYRISTSDVQVRGRRERGSGAAVGAAVSGTTGVVAGSRTAERVSLPANSQFRFRLIRSVTVQHPSTASRTAPEGTALSPVQHEKGEPK
jgi:hypothetical protein